MEETYLKYKKLVRMTVISTAFLLLGTNAELAALLTSTNPWLKVMYSAFGVLLIYLATNNVFKMLRLLNTAGCLDGTMRSMAYALQTVKNGAKLNELNLGSMPEYKRPDLIVPAGLAVLSWGLIAGMHYFATNGVHGPVLDTTLIAAWVGCIALNIVLLRHALRSTYYAAYTESFNAKVATFNNYKGPTNGYDTEETLERA